MFIATRNAHKVGEIRAILGGRFQILTLEDFPQAPKVVEDADTFAGNAAKKAMELARWIGSKSDAESAKVDFVLADDSGLEVDALNGAPGVYSARFAALDQHENSPDAANNAKLLKLLKDVPREKRTGRFRCGLHWRRCRKRPGIHRRCVMRMKWNRKRSMALARDTSNSRQVARAVLDMIRCLCQRDLSSHLPNWVRM